MEPLPLVVSAPEPAPEREPELHGPLPPAAGWAMVAVMALISLRGDGTFPFPRDTPAGILRAAETAQTFLLAALWVVLLSAGRPWVGRLERLARLPKLSSRAVSALAALFSIWTLAVHYFQSRHYAALGYSWSWPAFGLTFGLGAAGFAFLAARRASGKAVFLYGLVASAAFRVLPIAYFPLSPLRSDLIPKINLAALRLLEGVQPYGYLMLTPEVGAHMNYLPGTWLQFVPFAGLGLDPRWTTFVALYASAGLAWWWAGRRGGAPLRDAAGLLLVFLLVCPYLHYRHDIYSPAQWLTMVILVVAVSGRRPLLAGAAGGLALAAVQWNWPLAAFLGIEAGRRWGPRDLAKAGAVAAAVGGGLVLPFVLWGPAEFYGSALAVYSDLARSAGAPYPNMLGFTRILHSVGLWAWIPTIQAGAILGALGLAWLRAERLSDALRWATATLLFLMTINIFVWTYFFLHLYLLTVLFLVAELSGGSSDPTA